MTTTFHIGDMATFAKGKHWDRKTDGISFLVVKTKDVPANYIDYNPHTREGGVGHHQWLWIDPKDSGLNAGPYSGWFFEEGETK